MTILETLSFLSGMCILSIYLTFSLIKSVEGIGMNTSKYLKIFIFWLILHLGLSFDISRAELIRSVNKSDLVYRLEQYKSDDLILDKETYDKLYSLGNQDQLYIDQKFWVTISTNDGLLKYEITPKTYYFILNKKLHYIDIEYDAWGNKEIVNF